MLQKSAESFVSLSKKNIKIPICKSSGVEFNRTASVDSRGTVTVWFWRSEPSKNEKKTNTTYIFKPLETFLYPSFNFYLQKLLL